MGIRANLSRRRLSLAAVCFAMLSIPAIVAAQTGTCNSQNISATFSNMSVYLNAMYGTYIFNADVTIKYDCSSGTMSGCKVCTIDYLYKLNQGTGLYEFFSAVAADFSSGACSVTNQTAVFTDSFPGLTAPDNWKFVATGKSSSVSSPCSNPTGFSILKTQFFTSP